MCPFLNEEDFEDYEEIIEAPKKEEGPREEISFLKNDRKFFVIGGIASFVAFASVVYFFYSSSKPVNLDDLPIIKADMTPIKVRPSNNAQVKHQDKIVYDNISGDIQRKDEEERVIQPEEILSISEMDSDGVLSAEEKRKIISAFDDLAPAGMEKEYKINYVKNGNNEIEGENYHSLGEAGVARGAARSFTKEGDSGEELRIVEDDPSLPPINRVVEVKKTNAKTADSSVNKTNIQSKPKAKVSEGAKLSSKRHSKIADLLGRHSQQEQSNIRDSRKLNSSSLSNQVFKQKPGQTTNRDQNQRAADQQKFSVKSYVNQVGTRYTDSDGYVGTRYDGYGRKSVDEGRRYERSVKNSPSSRNASAKGVGTAARDAGIMVQIGSVLTKNDAESEYRRLANRNRFIGNYGRRIYKVNLGGSKGSRYRIQLGPFRSNAEAQKVISNLERNGYSAYISR